MEFLCCFRIHSTPRMNGIFCERIKQDHHVEMLPWCQSLNSKCSYFFFFKAGVNFTPLGQNMAPHLFFVNKVIIRQPHLLMYCLWLLSCDSCTTESLWQRLCSLQKLRHLLSAPSQKKLFFLTSRNEITSADWMNKSSKNDWISEWVNEWMNLRPTWIMMTAISVNPHFTLRYWVLREQTSQF